MNMSFLMVLAVFFPILCGVYVLGAPAFASREKLIRFTATGLFVTALLAFLSLLGSDMQITFLRFGEDLKIYFRLDALGRLFVVIVSIVWVLSGVFSFEYMKHESEEKRYFGFYLMVYGVLLALSFAGNLITFYVFYELMTLSSLPLVLHEKTREAIMAGLKYLFYSLFGAYLVLLGIYFLNRYTVSLDFAGGGTLRGVIGGRREGRSVREQAHFAAISV